MEKGLKLGEKRTPRNSSTSEFLFLGSGSLPIFLGGSTTPIRGKSHLPETDL